MKLNLIVSVIVALTIISASVLVLTNEKETDQDISEENQKSNNDDTSIVLGNISSFDEAVNVFGFNMFKQLNEENDGNIFFSPYSIFTALAMTYEGARNKTADEMSSVLNVEQNNESLHNYMKSLYEYLNKENDDYNISTANALWVNENFKLLEDYLKIIKDYYGGDATEVDYGNPQEAAGIINQWVESNTNGLIKDLITEGVISPLTRLILTNAIYFKGTWKVQFDPDNTTDRDFEISSGNRVEVSTMNLIETEDIFNYTETNTLQILELPYTSNDLSMIILLPKNNDLSNIIDSVDNDKLSGWKESMVEKSLDIYLPKFEIETKYSLKETLKQLGMMDPFTTAADFSGITGGKDLFISNVIHKAFVEINEEGTEAAAATAVIMDLTSVNGGGSSRIVFDCDHPFMYLIQHKETGTILFMGSINDPST